MCKRLCIFSIFDKEGKIDDYVLYVLRDLKKVCERLIIAINGTVETDGLRKLQTYTEEICIRDNVGYDAGAYKYILVNYLQENELLLYDEVVFCNDTFFGPITSFEKIFACMKDRTCDFWGLHGYLNVVFSYVESYFLVFRKNIIQKKLLEVYFNKFINENAASIFEVYCQFESGLFDYLVRQNQMTYSVYADEINIDIYRSTYLCLTKYNLPIIKKKAFSVFDEITDDIMCTLGHIKYETEYDVNLILESVKRIYGVNISLEEIRPIDNDASLAKFVDFPIPLVTEDEVERFIGEDKFYIYGAGMYAHKTFWRFAKGNDRFQGFIVSEEKKNNATYLFDKAVYSFSQVKDIYDSKVILGVVKENAQEIIKNFEKTDNVLRIY